MEVPEDSKVKQRSVESEGTLTTSSSASSLPQPIPGARPGVLDTDYQDGEYLAADNAELGSSAESDPGNMLDSMKEHLDRARNKIVDTLVNTAKDYRRTISLASSPSNSSDSLVKLQSSNSSQDMRSYDASIHTSQPKLSRSNVDLAEDALGMVGGGTPRTPGNMVARSNKDPQSPTAEFEIVTESEVKDALSNALGQSSQRNSQQGSPVPPPRRRVRLREGFRWQRQLVFRSKLTMHTAFERKDNKDPAAVTALAVSR